MFFRYVASIVAATFLVAAGCAQGPSADTENRAVGSDGWLKGTTDEKLDIVAGQLRGFDMAMVEVGYRFTELYFAGEERNWLYAKYHAEKIETAIRKGLERRPKRAASAETFLNQVVPEMLAAIEQKDLELFRQRFHTMHSACITCHVNEKVEFITVTLPKQHLAPVGPETSPR